jgi:NCS1 family nucleobase:cation symporter-1
MGEPEVSSASR